MTAPDNAAETADRVAAAVLAHPSVAGLHGGPHGVIATPLPGRKITGVRLGTEEEPAEIGVVLLLDRPLPEIVGELRAMVRELVGGPVDITVGDIVTAKPAEAGGQ